MKKDESSYMELKESYIFMAQYDPVLIDIKCERTRQKFRDANFYGPWMDERDQLIWTYKGMDCMIIRNPELFSLNAYVGLKSDHPLFLKSYDEVNPLVRVHGGITYADFSEQHITNGNSSFWWLGFDHGHAFDLIPSMQMALKTIDVLPRPMEFENKYYSFSEVKKECEDLAEQLLALKEHKPDYYAEDTGDT
jgi:hypothetical protein